MESIPCDRDMLAIGIKIFPSDFTIEKSNGNKSIDDMEGFSSGII